MWSRRVFALWALAGLIALLAPARAAHAQTRCVTPNPALESVRSFALGQVTGFQVALASVDLRNTTGVQSANFSDAPVGYVIADHMLRVLAPMALERVGERAFARRLRRLAPVDSQRTAFRAQDEAEDIANTLARRSAGGRVRWSTPRGAAIETVVEGAALAGYAASPGRILLVHWAATIRSGIGAAFRMRITGNTLVDFTRTMLVAATAVTSCPPPTSKQATVTHAR